MNASNDCFYCTDAHKAYMLEIRRLKISTVFLNREQEYLGRCYVVLNHHDTELFHLSRAERAQFMDEVAAVAQAIQKAFTPDKINYAVYGDITSHIHFHVVPKYKTGKNWGRPFELTAGQGKEVFLTAEQYQVTIDLIRKYLSDGGFS